MQFYQLEGFDVPMPIPPLRPILENLQNSGANVMLRIEPRERYIRMERRAPFK